MIIFKSCVKNFLIVQGLDRSVRFLLYHVISNEKKYIYILLKNKKSPNKLEFVLPLKSQEVVLTDVYNERISAFMFIQKIYFMHNNSWCLKTSS